MVIDIKLTDENANIPTRGTAFCAGYDLYANVSGNVEIMPHETLMIGTGIAMAIPQGYFGAVYARSGLASRESLRPANCVGVIDSDYRGEIKIPIHNDSKEKRIISPKDRIAQIIIQPFLEVEFNETDGLDDTDRGEKGFGSTGTK